MQWLKKGFDAMIGEPWLAISRIFTVLGLGVCLRQRRRNPAYVPLPGRIVYVAASSLPFHTSGYTTRTHEVIRALKAAGLDVVVLTRPGYPWDRRDRLCDPALEMTQVEDVFYAHERRPSNNRPVFQYTMQAAPVIAGAARKHRAAIIHAASNHTNALPALLAARRLGIPFHYEMRGLWELTRVSRMPEFEGSQAYRQGLALEALVAHHADRVYVISEQLKQYLAEQWGVPADRMALLPNCVDPERIFLSETTPAQPGVIGYAGSLINYEGLDVLVDAVDILTRNGLDIQVRIAGSGEARPQLEAQVQRLGLMDRIHFLGVLPPGAARQMISDCSVVCIPRRPFTVCRMIPPIKLAEALALEKPVIVPDLPVFRDELGDSRSGWFFKPGDAESLAEVMAEALGDDAELSARGKCARDHVSTRRNWQLFVSEIAASCRMEKH
ncbi:glycosyltransferase family 4 protein [Desulfosarcina sp. OttesenSCG-928-A07]|nr:glycosyltransferase family 4 protein [Desulfosarcina sp. OttesenSCG-928-G17]MDL2329830.1 glycosyltransferase family 4 protein [Desulfosarcina sp. OttesenSCG-928-A07]